MFSSWHSLWTRGPWKRCPGYAWKKFERQQTQESSWKQVWTWMSPQIEPARPLIMSSRKFLWWQFTYVCVWPWNVYGYEKLNCPFSEASLISKFQAYLSFHGISRSALLSDQVAVGKLAFCARISATNLVIDGRSKERRFGTTSMKRSNCNVWRFSSFHETNGIARNVKIELLAAGVGFGKTRVWSPSVLPIQGGTVPGRNGAGFGKRFSCGRVYIQHWQVRDVFYLVFICSSK